MANAIAARAATSSSSAAHSGVSSPSIHRPPMKRSPWISGNICSAPSTKLAARAGASAGASSASRSSAKCALGKAEGDSSTLAASSSNRLDRVAACVTTPRSSTSATVALAASAGTTCASSAWMPSRRSSTPLSAWLSPASRLERRVDSSASRSAASEAASATRSSAWRAMRRCRMCSSTNTRIFERSTSGTTGDGM